MALHAKKHALSRRVHILIQRPSKSCHFIIVLRMYSNLHKGPINAIMTYFSSHKLTPKKLFNVSFLKKISYNSKDESQFCTSTLINISIAHKKQFPYYMLYRLLP